MPLVDYASSSEDEGGEDRADGQASGLPGLPADLLDLYQVDPRRGDDPAFHQGRLRTHQHVSGEWPTHVYLDFWLQPALSRTLSHALVAANGCTPNKFTSLLTSQHGVERELHVSLTRPIMLETDQRMAFGNRISQIESTSIDLSFEGFAVFSNDEETRQFLVAKLSRTSNDALRDIRVSLDAILSQFDLPALYKEPQFHASFAWRDYDDGDSEWLLERLDTAFTADLRSQHIEIDCIKVKIGKDVTVVPLAQKLRGGRN